MAPSKRKKSKEAKSKEAARRSKAGGKLSGSENIGQQQQADVQVDSCAESQWGPADEATHVNAFWRVLTEEQRQELLTLNRQQLQQTALELTQAVNSHSLCSLDHATLLSGGKSLVEVLDQGMKRLQACSTAGSSWKRWYWPDEHQGFNDAASFREYVLANHIDQELLQFLPEGAAIKAEADAIRRRMVGLCIKVLSFDQAYKKGALSEHIPERATELITMILAALEEREHFYLYHFFLFPVISAICKALPKSKRATSIASGFSYCDLEKLPHHVLLNISDWLHAGVSMLSRFKSETFGKEWLLPEERKGSAASNAISVSAVDGDKFCISSRDKTQVQLNTSWYKYLKGHVHGDSSEDVENILPQEPEYADRCDFDYRLQWVLGIQLDPSSYRGWIQSSIGAWVPTVEYNHLSLLSALRDMKEWQTRANETKHLLQEMLVSRQALAEIKLKHDVSPRPNREKNQYPCELPDHVVVALLKREALLVRVRLHTVEIQQIMDKERLRHLQTKQNQGEPKFARWDAALKAEYAELQGQSSGRPGPKSHLDVVTDKSGLFERFESLGALLRAHEAEEREVSIQIRYHDEELKQFAGWSENSIKMATSIEEMAAAKARPLIEGLEEGAICPCCNTSTCPSLAAGRQVAMQVHEDQAEKLRETAAMLKQAFQTDVRYQLHDEAEDQRVYKLAQKQLKQIEKRQQQGQAVLPLLENSMIELACDDPGTVIGPQIILPTLRKRLLARAQSFHQAATVHYRLERDMQQEAAALLASQELLAEEELEQARAAAKKAKKDRANAKSAASQKLVQEQPLSQPGSPVPLPSANSLAETENQHKYDELFTSSTTNRDRTRTDKLAAPATSELEFGPSSTSSGRTSIGATDHTEWFQTGRKGSVLKARVSVMTAEKVLLEPGLPSESSGLATESSDSAAESSGLAAKGSGLAAEGSGLATDTSISSSCVGSSMQEQSVLHLMTCPLMRAVMIDPVIAADGHTYERSAMQKWLQEHQTSPVTGKALKHIRLVPNVVIRSVIQQQLLCI